MRKIQKETCDKTPNCEMVENYDLGEWNDIHPLDKKTLAERIAAMMNLTGKKSSKKNKR